jgi:uncharacterized cupredoxin-like copper-binding protein
MTTATEEKQPHTTATEDLEAELEEMRRELQAKRSRNGGVQLAAFFAVLLAMAAFLAVVFKLDDSQNSTTAMHNQMRGNMPAAMGAAGSGGASQSSVGAVHQVSAQLGDYWVRPNVTSVPAGKVTFNATNAGQVPHELMIERMPIKMDAPGQPNEDAAQGMIDDMGPGQSGHMTINLKPGTYMLFCNVPGHYTMGQHTMFKVTG